MPLIREQLNKGQTVRFSPRGTSMLPLLRHGKDSVELSPLPEKLKKYDIIFYQRPNGHYVLHRIIGIANDQYTCMGDHQYVSEPGITHESVIAIVSGIYRGNRHYTASSLLYRIYSRCWVHSRFLRALLVRIAGFWKKMTKKLT